MIRAANRTVETTLRMVPTTFNLPNIRLFSQIFKLLTQFWVTNPKYDFLSILFVINAMPLCGGVKMVNRSKFKRVHRTSFRIEKEDWSRFKKVCELRNKTTCQILRQLIVNYLRNPAIAGMTETQKNNSDSFGKERGGWVYHKPSMTLYNTKFFNRK